MLEAPADLTEAPEPVDVLSDFLRAVRLSGAVFFRARFTAPWGLSSPDSAQLARVLLPAARQMVMFHAVERGSCWLEIEGQPRAEVRAGEVVVVPFGDPHAMGCGEPARVESVAQLFPGPPPWPEPPRLVYGGAGAPTEIVCGFLHLDQALFNPLLSSLPRVLLARPDGTAPGRLLESSLEFMRRELDAEVPGSASVLARLTELLFVQVLRQYVAQLSERELGWLAALRDRNIGQSLRNIHEQPAYAWTVDELARRSAMSRSGFAARFTELLGEAPAQYLTRWRLQLASQRLREGDENLAEIAAAVGYASEAAFSRAFKREAGKSPAQFRREARG